MKFTLALLLCTLVTLNLYECAKKTCTKNNGSCQPDGSLGYCCSNYCHKEPNWPTGYCRAAIKEGENICIKDNENCQPDGRQGACCSKYCHKEPHWVVGYCSTSP